MVEVRFELGISCFSAESLLAGPFACLLRNRNCFICGIIITYVATAFCILGHCARANDDKLVDSFVIHIIA